MCTVFYKVLSPTQSRGQSSLIAIVLHLSPETDREPVKGAAPEAANPLSRVLCKAESLDVKPGRLNRRLKPGILLFQFCSYVLPAAPQYLGIFLPLQEETKEAVKGEAKTEVKNRWKAAPRRAPA